LFLGSGCSANERSQSSNANWHSNSCTWDWPHQQWPEWVHGIPNKVYILVVFFVIFCYLHAVKLGVVDQTEDQSFYRHIPAGPRGSLYQPASQSSGEVPPTVVVTSAASPSANEDSVLSSSHRRREFCVGFCSFVFFGCGAFYVDKLC
jgi:hypothetical protein